MKTRFALLGTALTLFSLAACGTEEAPEADGAPAVETEPAVSTAQPAAPVEGGAALTVSRTAEYGPYLADASGRALYLLEADSQGNSNCYDACAEVWPPYLAPQGTPTAGAAEVQAGMIGTLQRRDGSNQVTYNGHPLYYYSKDQGPGRATGQDVHDEWGEWYLVTLQGQKLEESGGAGRS